MTHSGHRIIYLDHDATRRPPDSERHGAVVQRMIELIQRRDVEGYEELLAKDVWLSSGGADLIARGT